MFIKLVFFLWSSNNISRIFATSKQAIVKRFANNVQSIIFSNVVDMNCFVDRYSLCLERQAHEFLCHRT